MKSRRLEPERAQTKATGEVGPALGAESGRNTTADPIRDELAALEAGWDELLS